MTSWTLAPHFVWASDLVRKRISLAVLFGCWLSMAYPPITSLFTTIVTLVPLPGQLGRSWRIRSGSDGAVLSRISCDVMTFVRGLVVVLVGVWSPAAVPELAHAPATTTRPNAKAMTRMGNLLLSGAQLASRVDDRK